MNPNPDQPKSATDRQRSAAEPTGPLLDYETPRATAFAREAWLTWTMRFFWVSVILVLFVIVIGLLQPPTSRARESANLVKCASGMRQIAAAIRQYHASHGTWPMDLPAILEGGIASERLTCPSSATDRAIGSSTEETIRAIRANPQLHLAYGYIKPATANPPATEVLVFDLPGNHVADGGQALLIDGRIVWRKPAELQALAQRQVP